MTTKTNKLNQIALGIELRKTRLSYTTTLKTLGSYVGRVPSEIHFYETGAKAVPPEILKKINKFYGTKITYPKNASSTILESVSKDLSKLPKQEKKSVYHTIKTILKNV